jgi:hypothetical protein
LERKKICDIVEEDIFYKLRSIYPSIPYERVTLALKNIKERVSDCKGASWRSELLFWYCKILGMQMPRKKPKLIICLILVFCDETIERTLKEKFKDYPMIGKKSWEKQLHHFQSEGLITIDHQLTDKGKQLKEIEFQEMMIIMKSFFE